MKITRTHIVLLLLSVIALGSIDASAQLPVRTRTVQIFSDNNTNYIEFVAPNGVTSNMTYTLPSTIPPTPGISLRLAAVPAPTATSATLEWTPEPPAPAPLFAYVGADQAFGTTVLGNVTGLSLTPLVANAVYEFEAVIAYDGGNVGADLQIAFVTTNTTFIRWSAMGNAGASVAPVSVTGSGTAMTDIPTNSTSFSTDMSIHVKGMLIVGATDGTIQLQAATTTGGNTVNILRGTFLKATRMTN
jgi:hypothetical protein